MTWQDETRVIVESFNLSNFNFVTAKSSIAPDVWDIIQRWDTEVPHLVSSERGPMNESGLITKCL